jgi:NAD dependent epimerase/dehydratase family enzyme
MALGEMADEMLLSSTRADAGRLKDAGFKFRDPQLAAFLCEEVR